MLLNFNLHSNCCADFIVRSKPPQKVLLPPRSVSIVTITTIIYSHIRYKRERYRQPRWCPVHGCTSKKPQKKLSNHLTYAHPDLEKSQRKRFLRGAKKSFGLPAALGQKQLHFDISAAKPSAAGPSSSPSPSGSHLKNSSRGMSKFPLTHPSLRVFMEHLRRLDGEEGMRGL